MIFGLAARALLTSLLLILCFPRPDQGYLALAALVPLLWAAEASDLRRAFLLGWLSGAVWFYVSLNWLTFTLSFYGHIPVVLSHALILLLACFYGLTTGLFALLFHLMGSRTVIAQAILAPSAWVVGELVRNWVPAPFPWLLLGSAFWRYPAAGQVYSVAGVYGASWLAAAANVLLWRAGKEIFERRHKKAALVLILPAVAAAALFMVDVNAGGDAKGQGLKVGVIQGNFPQEEKWEEELQDETVETYLDLSREAVGRGARLVVWPETAVPFYFQQEEEPARKIRRFVAASGADLIFGSPAFELVERSVVLYNRAYYLSGDGVQRYYDKVVLVPFGEYIPFRWLLPFVERMVPGGGNFVPGRWKGPFPTAVPAGTLICYEVAMPGLARREVKDGARLLVNLTNDGWFGDSWGPYQHLALAAVRSAENGVPLVRAANTGISAVFDRRGRLTESLGLDRRGFIVADVPTVPSGRNTLYTRFGDWIVTISAAVIIIWFLRFLVRIRRRTDG